MNNSTMDFRAGGEWIYSMRSDEFWTDAFCDSSGKISEDLPQGRSTLTFTEHDGITISFNQLDNLLVKLQG
ncbi:hypothetical protein FHU41_001914 [Psychromicrobium silvestre]|uniref:Uncharacterized protein n=1 Tax=Psychromicrobium silvestre TaxID=1645614 RepID=A0A7Y9LU52_9MICC|nr:hypothetical protein [Psychromicrobium silvestre]